MKRIFYFMPMLLLLVLAGMLFALLKQNLRTVQEPPASEENRPLPEFAIQGLSSNDIKGSALLHITASWCAMCKIEHPLLMRLAKKVPIYGVAWKDKEEPLQTWLERAGNPYRKIGMDDGRLGLELGITGTPESFLISKDRRIIAHFRGPLTEEQIMDIPERLKR